MILQEESKAYFTWSRHKSNAEFEQQMLEVINSGDFVLDVGCGHIKTDPKLIGVDAYEDHPMVNVKAYMWDMPFEDGSIDGILCMMALEHISKFQVMPTLIEFNRVLKKGAKFIILVPNFLWILEQFIKKPNAYWEMDMIFGIQTHDGEYHRTGFTREILTEYFEFAIPNCEITVICDVNAYNQMGLGVVARKG